MTEKMLVLFNDRKMIEGIDYTYTSGDPSTISFYGILRGPLWLRMLFAYSPAKLRKSDMIEFHYECYEDVRDD